MVMGTIKNYNRKLMSILLDELLKEERIMTYIEPRWYMAKPIPYYSIKTLLNRVRDAIRVIRGKSFAVHYKEDEQLKKK
jgi:hypothetical protein